jgi:hypothetical protein
MTEENLLQLGVGSMVIHPSFGRGILVEESDKSYKIFFYDIDKAKEIDRTFDKLDIITKTAPQQTLAPIDLKDIEELFLTTVFKYFDPPINIPLAGKWIDGKIIITSGDTSLQPKEIPTEQFFHKIVMLRDRLRVLEQNINTHPKLNDEDRLHLQQYITRIYGSLTTFNVLFKEKDHQFKGTGSEKD